MELLTFHYRWHVVDRQTEWQTIIGLLTSDYPTEWFSEKVPELNIWTLTHVQLPTEWLMDQPCAWSTLRERQCRDWLTGMFFNSFPVQNLQFTKVLMQTKREGACARKRATNLQTQVCSKVDFNSFPPNINCPRASEPSNSKRRFVLAAELSETTK